MLLETTYDDPHPREVSSEDVIRLLYAGLLRRDGDPAGVRAHADHLDRLGLLATIRNFAQSHEYASLGSRLAPGFVELNFKGAMSVETDVSEEELGRMWRHVSAVWSALGNEDALWSVLTDEKFRAGNLSPEAVETFYASGRTDAAYLSAFLDRAGIDPTGLRVGAEYGCGVGRITPWLAPMFGELRAFDISEPHLAAASLRAAGGSANVRFVHVRDRDDLAELAGVDLFFSLIVLQHNPPPIILDILDRAFAGLNPGGIAFFQVPTFGADYGFSVERYWIDLAAKKEMEVHFVPQAAIHRLAERHRLQLLEMRQDHCIGNYDKWISHTFLFRKGGGAA